MRLGWAGWLLSLAAGLSGGWSGARAAELERMTWDVGGVTREAWVARPTGSGRGDPASTRGAPLVLVFHGHGGSMQNAARSFHLHTLWPEACVVYPQGLPTPGQLTDPEGRRAGWQGRVGDQGDRDLAFVDAILARFRSPGEGGSASPDWGAGGPIRIDPRRIYATGHSNGGGFTYLLWAERPAVFAALAPSSALLGRNAHRPEVPRPLLHVAGRTDPLVKFSWQQAAMAEARRVNQCVENARPWLPTVPLAQIYDSPRAAPVVTLIHSGGHTFYASAPAAIVAFFKEHSLPEGEGGGQTE